MNTRDTNNLDDTAYWASVWRGYKDVHDSGEGPFTIDDQDYVKRNGRMGPKDEGPLFLTLKNIKEMLGLYNQLCAKQSVVPNQRQFPQEAKEWWRASKYNQMMGQVNLDEINYDFLQYMTEGYVHPVYLRMIWKAYKGINDDTPWFDEEAEEEESDDDVDTDEEEYESFIPNRRPPRKRESTYGDNNDRKNYVSKDAEIRARQLEQPLLQPKYTTEQLEQAKKTLPYVNLGKDMGSKYTTYDYGAYEASGSAWYNNAWDEGTYTENIIARQTDEFNRDIPSISKDISQYRFDKFQRGKHKMYRIDNQFKRNYEWNIDEGLRQPYEMAPQPRPRLNTRELYYRFHNPENQADDKCDWYDIGLMG